MKRVLSATLLGALALAACDDASGPDGTAGTVTASVYVDTDATGTLTDADDPLTGMEVALTRDGATIQTAEVDADGQVTFTDVEPGSYQLVITSEDPAGTALTGSRTPSAVVPFTGGAVDVDFRFVYFPGSLSGRVYRDDDGSGAFEAGNDTPGADLKVVLMIELVGGEIARIDSVRTDSEGRYEFDRLAPGEFMLEFETPGTIEYGVEGPTRTVVVEPSEPTVFDITFTGSAIITIAEARALEVGSGAAVRGFVTVPPGIFNFVSSGTTYSEIWIQDATGGIASIVVAPAEATTIALGDELEVVGTVQANAGQLQIGNQANLASVTELAGNDVVEPLGVGQAEIALFNRQGELVTAGPLVVTSVGTASSTTGAFTVNTTLPNGSAFAIRVPHSNTGLVPADFTVGETYYVTGILTRFNANPQIKPRFETDVIQRDPISIAAVRAAAVGDTVAFTGVVTVPPGSFTSGSGGVNSEIWVQDETGGIAVFSVPSSMVLPVGDSVDVLGVRGSFNGQAQVASGGGLRVVVMPRNGSAPVMATPITGVQLNSFANEGELVVIEDLTVTAIGGGTGSSFNVTATHPDGSTVTIRVTSAGTGLTRESFAIGTTYDVTGVVGRFNATAQIKPRFATDVVVP